MWFLFLVSFLILSPPLLAAPSSPNIPTNKVPYVGTFYMPGFKVGSILPGWRGIENFDPSRKPLLGYFDEGNPETMDWEIKWALENGINFFIFDWFRCADGTNIKCNGDTGVLGKPITPDKLMYSASLHQGFLKSQFQNQMKFAIMLTRHGDNVPLFSTKEDFQNNLLPFIIDNYLKKSNYLKIGNRPVIFFFGVENPDNSSGYNKINSEIIQLIRQRLQESGLGDPYLIAEDRNFTARKNTVIDSYKQIGYDHSFSYWPQVYQSNGEYFWGKAASITEDQALNGMKESYDWLKNNQHLPFITNANPMANGVNQPLWTLSPPKYENLITYLNSNIMPSIQSDLGKQMLIVDAWNEIVEGHWIAPTNKYGFDYLKSIRKILTQQNNSPDYRSPAETGNGPYDSEYQNLLKRVVSPSVFENSEFSFTGNNDYKIADKSPTGNTNKLSFGAWFNFPKPSTNFIPLEKGYGSLHMVLNAYGGGQCAISTSDISWYKTGSTASWDPSTITFNEWHHLFCVYDGSKLHTYLDGKKAGTSNISVTGLTSDPYNDFTFGKNYQGKIAKLKVVKEAYTDSQVLALYNSTKIISTPTLPPPTITQTPSSTLIPTQPPLSGDANGDGKVDATDFNIWKMEYSSILFNNNPRGKRADFNKDNKIDLVDYSIWRAGFCKN